MKHLFWINSLDKTEIEVWKQWRKTRVFLSIQHSQISWSHFLEIEEILDQQVSYDLTILQTVSTLVDIAYA